VTTALYPGTFDPAHLGHLDVIVRASHLFERLVVAVSREAKKNGLFSVEERAEMLREATAGLRGVEVVAYGGLTAVFAQSVGAEVIVKGLRGPEDFAAEARQMLMNRHLGGPETLFLLPSPLHTQVSSTLIREVTRLGGDASAFVPEAVARRLTAPGGRGRRRTGRGP
jgi:pantetheine-phosphate adenylyltransferase